MFIDPGLTDSNVAMLLSSLAISNVPGGKVSNVPNGWHTIPLEADPVESGLPQITRQGQPCFILRTGKVHALDPPASIGDKKLFQLAQSAAFSAARCGSYLFHRRTDVS